MKNDNRPWDSPNTTREFCRQPAGWCVWFGLSLALSGPFCALAQSHILAEYLPYSPSVTATFSSTAGLVLEVEGDSSTDFHWHATHPALEGLKQDYRLNASGLALLAEYGTTPGSGTIVYTETYTPAWVVAPAIFTNGQVVPSAATYAGNEPGVTWTGNANGTLTLGAVETVATPAGTFQALKATFINSWSETGTGYTSSGITTQIWWMARSVGLVKLQYGYEEEYIENGQPPDYETEQVTFELVSNSLLVTFQDPRLLAAVRTALGKPTGGITRAEMAGLTSLSANNRAITNLTGLEYAVNLTFLNVTQNAIRDLTPLAGLTNLFELSAGLNQIQDLQPLSQMTDLFSLQLFNNQISDLTPLVTLDTVANLWINNNQVADLSPLPGMSGLRSLIANDNQITDLSPLGGMPGLIAVNVARNRIVNVTALSSLTGLIQIQVQDNLLVEITSLTTLTNLTSAYVSLNFLDLTPGADDRLVIDGWLARGAAVTFSPQRNLPQMSITRLGGNLLRLGWNSSAGLSYQIQNTTNLATWSSATNPPLVGTGNPLTVDFPLAGVGQGFRLQVSRP